MKQTQEILNRLAEIIENGSSSKTILILEKIGLSEDEINKVLDIITQAIGRAGLYRAGAKKEQFSHYLDKNPIFEKTIELVLSSEVNVSINTANLHPKLQKAFDFEDKKIDIEQLFTDFNNPNEKNRDDALYQIIEHKHPNYLELIEKSIDDDDEMVQIIAIQAISKENINENIKQKILNLFKKTENHTLVSNLTQQFSELNIQQAVPLLLEKLQSENLMVIYDSILCLGDLADESIIENLKPFKELKEYAEIYDEDGVLKQCTGYTISEITKKAIKQIKKRIKKS